VARSRAGREPAPDPDFSICTSTAEETQRVGEALGAALRRTVAADRAPAVVALAGPLGAGKTNLVQGMARGLQVSGGVRSPTFTLIHEHPGAVPLFHVDLYRLDAHDAEGLGLDEITDIPGVTAIEWAERASGVLPDTHLWIEFAFGQGESERCLRLIPRGKRYERLVVSVRECEFWR
jgi:tRNA threonylcarbamoyladenosine biosynthesis protein TsaE